MGEPQQTIAVAGTTPFAFILAGLLAADHGCKVFIVAQKPSAHGVPPLPSFSISPITRPDTLQLALANGPAIMRRIGRIAPESVNRVDVTVSAATPYHATALSHLRHLATGFGQTVERVVDSVQEAGSKIRIRDAIRLSPTPFLAQAHEWATRIGIEWIEDIGSLSIKRSGVAHLADIAVDQLVLADDDAIFRYLEPDAIAAFGRNSAHLAFIAERAHGVGETQIALSHGVLLDPQDDGSLAIYAENVGGHAEGRIAASLPDGTTVRRAAQRGYRALLSHDGAPIVGVPKRSRTYIAAGLGALDIVLAPTLARHIAGQAHGYEAEWCGLRTPSREMTGSMVADVMHGAVA